MNRIHSIKYVFVFTVCIFLASNLSFANEKNSEYEDLKKGLIINSNLENYIVLLPSYSVEIVMVILLIGKN